jgi:putative redox protein
MSRATCGKPLLRVATLPDAGNGVTGESEAMSLTATSHAIRGTLRQHVVIDGRHHLATDEPARLGGEGTAPAPHELLPAALASCVSTSLVMYARQKGWDLGDVTVDVDFDNTTTPRVCRIEIDLGAVLTDEQLVRLEKVARACPVRRSLEGGVEFRETLRSRRALTERGAA